MTAVFAKSHVFINQFVAQRANLFILKRSPTFDTSEGIRWILSVAFVASNIFPQRGITAMFITLSITLFFNLLRTFLFFLGYLLLRK